MDAMSNLSLIKLLR